MQVQESMVQSKAATAISTLRYATGNSVLGLFLVATSAQGIACIVFGDSRQAVVDDLQLRFGTGQREDVAGLARIIARVAAMIADPGTQTDLPLDPMGSNFQRKVWQALRQIPAGKTASYGEIARRIGQPSAMRAVAQACGANPIAIAIPCHRVVRSDGSQGGYRWGVERKAMLLRAEAAL